MNNDEAEDWDDDDENEDDWGDEERLESSRDAHKRQHEIIQNMFSDMEKRAKKSIEYLMLEGFIEPTEVPGVYEYTPEGLVLARQKYKKMLEDGLNE
jgi:hypothetical protein